MQHGWSRNGGFFKAVGSILLYYYNTPEKVEYLFGSGQLKMLWTPYSEYLGGFFKNIPTDKPHYVDNTERWIFGRIAFADYGYFYDFDNRWY